MWAFFFLENQSHIVWPSNPTFRYVLRRKPKTKTQTQSHIHTETPTRMFVKPCFIIETENRKQLSDHQLVNYKQIAMFPSYRILISNELEKLIYANTSKWSQKQRTLCYMILFSWNSERKKKKTCIQYWLRDQGWSRARGQRRELSIAKRN